MLSEAQGSFASGDVGCYSWDCRRGEQSTRVCSAVPLLPLKGWIWVGIPVSPGGVGAGGVPAAALLSPQACMHPMHPSLLQSLTAALLGQLHCHSASLHAWEWAAASELII